MPRRRRAVGPSRRGPAAWTRLGWVVVLALAAPAHAQDPGAVSEGDRVRLTRLDGSVVTGTFLSASDGRILLRPQLGGTAPSFSVSEITDLERSLGHHRRFWRHFGITLGGAVTALTLAVALTWEPCTNWCNSFDESRASAALFYGPVLGLFIGAPVGALVGSAIKTERWESVSPGTTGSAWTLRPILGRRPGFSLSYAPAPR